jgi:hypothetical protein
MTDAGHDELLEDATTWPATLLDTAGQPASLLIWQPHGSAIELRGTETVDIVVRDLLHRGLHLVVGGVHPDAFALAIGWRATVEPEQVVVHDADGRLAVLMQADGPGDIEWQQWRRTALHRREVWVAAAPGLADPATGMPDLLTARGQLVAGAVPVQRHRPPPAPEQGKGPA